TGDHHIDPGAHFSEHPDFLGSWPPHCRVGTPGVELHPSLDRSRLEAILDKGEYQAAYSGFEGVSDGTSLTDWLRAHDVDTVEIIGLTTDYCGRATALAAVAGGVATTVRLGLTAGGGQSPVGSTLTHLRGARGTPPCPTIVGRAR